MAQVIRSAQIDEEPVLIRCRRAEPLPLETPVPAPAAPAQVFIEPAAPVEDPREALEELRRQGAEAGYREGLERGEREARAALAEEKALLAKETERLRALAGSLGEALGRAIGGAEDAMVEIAFAAVCKVLGEAAASEEGVRAMVQQAMREVRAKENMVLRVAPADYERLARLSNGESGRLELVADERVALGGCLIETAGGTLDARLEVQLRQLVDTLTRAGEAAAE